MSTPLWVPFATAAIGLLGGAYLGPKVTGKENRKTQAAATAAARKAEPYNSLLTAASRLMKTSQLTVLSDLKSAATWGDAQAEFHEALDKAASVSTQDVRSLSSVFEGKAAATVHPAIPVDITKLERASIENAIAESWIDVQAAYDALRDQIQRETIDS